MTATDRLTSALIALADGGDRPRCSDPGDHELWLSESAEDRELAVRFCIGCPILEACGDAANEMDERWGVWAGVDRSPQNRAKRGVITHLPTPADPQAEIRGCA